MPTSVTTTAELLLLTRGEIRVEIALRPFSFTVRRRSRRLLRAAGVWVADGAVQDTFVQFTEGVIAHEDLAAVERARGAEVLARDDADGVALELVMDGGRCARLQVALSADNRVSLSLMADGQPLRPAIDWDRRSEERFVGLRARHCTQFDQAGRSVQLGADRRYTGPDCRRRCSPPAGSPRATARRWRGCSRAGGTRS